MLTAQVPISEHRIFGVMGWRICLAVVGILRVLVACFVPIQKQTETMQPMPCASVVELPTVESRLAGRSFGRSGRGGFAEDQLADRVETCDAGCGTLGQLQDMGSKAVRPHSQPCCRESRGADGNAPRVWRLFTASACSIWNR